MSYPVLVTMQLAFKTTEDPDQLAERIREAVHMIVGRQALEDLRWRSMPLEPGATG